MSILGTNSAIGSLTQAVLTGVTKAAAKDNDLSSTAVVNSRADLKEEVTKAIEAAPTANSVAVVEVKSAWQSKINATNVAAILAMLGTILPIFGLEFSAETQRDILAGVIAIAGVGTVIFKTWFSKTITPASAGK